MAELTVDALDTALHYEWSDITPRPHLYYIPQADTVMWCALHLQNMINEFKERYYATLKSE
jgi:hypothetical protein